MISIAATFFIVFLLAFYYKVLESLKNKHSKYLRNIEILKIQHEKEILTSQLEIQESTFKKISQDIHDNISLSLTLAKLNINTFLMSQTHLKFEQLHSATDLIGRSLLDLNNISRSLNSDIVAHYGLTRAVEMELDKLNQLHQCTFIANFNTKAQNFDKKVELEMFRILQESCNNIIKHSEAAKADITIGEEKDKVTLCIQDDGKGFDENDLEERQAIAPRSGLKNIRNRARMLNGDAHISSFPGKGTKIQITIPIEHDKSTH